MNKLSNSYDGWKISAKPIFKYNIIFCIIVIICIFIGDSFIAVRQIQQDAKTLVFHTDKQISYRLTQSIALLESLAAQPEYYNPTIDSYLKADRLDQISPHFNYIMIRYVDSDMSVWRSGKPPASLASRDYMQALFAAGTPQITDSFPMGADGRTLNYTIAVPLFNKHNNITGCLFCAISFDEIVNLMKEVTATYGGNITLLGSKGQVMSSTTSHLAYGSAFKDHLHNTQLFGTTAERLEQEMLTDQLGSCWAIENGTLAYIAFSPIQNSSWYIACSLSFWEVYSTFLTTLAQIALVLSLFCGILIWNIQRYTKTQIKNVDTIIDSIKELERNINHDNQPEHISFDAIIRLTSEGLIDSLTGVATRTVFFDKAKKILANPPDGKLTVLCFVDLDHLKQLNDVYGHPIGDTALKSIGYILREYGKRYDGLVGRHGGDEFVMLLRDIDDEQELYDIMDEMILRLHTYITADGTQISIQCSVGVAICQPQLDIEALIADADEALYFVKRNGKGYYKIYQN